MSREFTATSDRITQGTVTMPVIGSLAFWVYPTWAQTDGADHMFFNCNTAGSQYFGMQKYSDNTLYLGWYGGSDDRVSVASASYTLNQNAWNHMALTWDDTANETRAYLNGALIGSPTAALTTGTTTSRIIGNYDVALDSKDVRGRMAEFAIWDAVLTLPEIVSLSLRVAPLFIRPGNITDYLPLIGKASPEQNLFGGDPGTIASGTAVANHSPMIYPGYFNTAHAVSAAILEQTHYRFRADDGGLAAPLF